MISRFFLLFALLLSSFAQAESLEHAIMPGQLIQGHVKYEDKCESCHKRFDKAGQDKLCMDCHKDIGRDVKEKKGLHGRQLSTKACKECHTDHKGRAAKVVILDEKTFKHKEADFQLKGKHAEETVKCVDCHQPKAKWRDAPNLCVDCHKKEDTKAHGGKLGTDCAKCHTDKDWKVPDFDHSKTKFVLHGKHVSAKCSSCHLNSNYKETPIKCFECHKKDDDKAHNRVFGTKCETCHGDDGWKVGIKFNHDRDTKFALKEKHRDAKCSTCHKVAGEKLLSTCVSCHKKEDIHKGSLGDKCGDCHNAINWKSPKDFDHAKDTRYPLLGKHKVARCDACHTTGHDYKKLPMDCYSCHKGEDQKIHKGNYGRNCENCHKETDWKQIVFNHDVATKYKLLFKHREVKCDKCHAGKVYGQNLSQNCYDCHKKTDDATGHKGSLGKKCESCHNEKGWKVDAKFDHNQSRFPLLGMHTKTDCKKCHISAKYSDAKSDCYACHKKDDKHELKFGTKCDSCHNARDWKSWDFDHDKRTQYKLDGAHKKVACYDCHRKPVTSEKLNTPTSCAACHNSDDIHEGGFGKQCERCHTTNSFKEIRPKTGI
ncbi:MAG: cytochrome C [Methylophilaceae bacterium]|nr:MAG: cytochrome C [Methylophilaceae bacterium]